MLATPDPLWISRSDGERIAYFPGMVMAPEFWRYYSPPSMRSGRVCAYPLPAHYPWSTGDAAQLLSTDEIVEAYASALRRDFDTGKGGRKITLVGHSTGGFIALLLARRHPELVEKMILLGAFGCGRFEGAGRFAMRLVSWPLMGEMIFTTLLSRWISTPERFRQGSLACVHRDREDWYTEPATLAQEEVRLSIGKSNPNEIAALVRWLFGQSIMADLPLIDVPTLFIIGSKDAVVPPAHQLSTARRMPNAAAVIIPEVGHLPMVEAPEAFDRAAAMFGQMRLAAAADRTIRTGLKRLARVSSKRRASAGKRTAASERLTPAG